VGANLAQYPTEVKAFSMRHLLPHAPADRMESLCPVDVEGKDFSFYKQEGGEITLAFTKEEKTKIVAQYTQWLNKSQAVFIMEYKNMNQKPLDAMRARIRENGGELHVVKNTLFKLVLDKAHATYPKDFMDKSNIVVFALHDAAGMAKTINEGTQKQEVFKVKGGYLGRQFITAAEIQSLAELPPLPVMRARLLGTLLAPAGRLVRTLAEPARSLAGILKAYSEKEQGAAPVAG
jgi:large subunit ribosomal protein L10